MKELKMQGIMTLMLAIIIVTGWGLFKLLKAILLALPIPVLIIIICMALYKFLNLR